MTDVFNDIMQDAELSALYDKHLAEIEQQQNNSPDRSGAYNRSIFIARLKGDFMKGQSPDFLMLTAYGNSLYQEMTIRAMQGLSISVVHKDDDSKKTPSLTPWEDAKKHNTNRW